jgi:hypothetical protein
VSETKTSAGRVRFNRTIELVGETRRVRPTGIIGFVVATFSVIAVFLIGWLALFGVVTQHQQVALFLMRTGTIIG